MKVSFTFLGLLFIFFAQGKDTLYIYVDNIRYDNNLIVHSFQEDLKTDNLEVYAKAQYYGFSFINNDSGSNFKHIKIVDTPYKSFTLKLTVMFFNDVFEMYGTNKYLKYKYTQGFDTANLKKILTNKTPKKEYQNLKCEQAYFKDWFAKIKWRSTASVFSYIPIETLSLFLKNKQVVHVSDIKSEEDFFNFREKVKHAIIYLIDENSKNKDGYLIKNMFYEVD